MGSLPVLPPVFRGGGPGSIPTLVPKWFPSHDRTRPSLLAFPSELCSLLHFCHCLGHGASIVLYLEAPILTSARNLPVEVPSPLPTGFL